MELYNEGLNDLQMSEMLGVKPCTVGEWRRRMRLYRDTRRNAKTVKEKPVEPKAASAPDAARDGMSLKAAMQKLTRFEKGWPEGAITVNGAPLESVIVLVKYQNGTESACVDIRGSAGG
jgi:hypothetical protein